MEEFNRAIENEDEMKAKNIYGKLEQILHPSSELRTILSIDLSSISSDNFEGEEVND